MPENREPSESRGVREPRGPREPRDPHEPRDPREQRTQVLVVGAGLAGLSTALFLSWHGVPALVVERHQGMSPHPRARGIHPRAMELLRGVGLEGPVRATSAARALARNSGVHAARSLAGPELGRLHESYFMDVRTDLSGLSPTTWCLCHQDELEPVVRRRGEELGAVFRYGTELTSLTQDEMGVSATVRDRKSDRLTSVRADYAVAADGPGSPVRTALGIGRTGVGTTGHFLNIHFEADLTAELGDRRFIMMYTFDEAVRGALMPLDNARRWLLHVPFDPAREDVASFTGERCRSLVRAAAGVPDLVVDVLGAVPWEAAGLSADAYRAGRVFLVGDAAHVMPPSGAFGSSTGIQDAHNLAWKLAAVLRGEAGPALLDSYDAERRPVGAATVDQAVLRSQDRPRLAETEPPPANPAIVADATIWFGAQYRSTALSPSPTEPPPPEGPFNPTPTGAPGTRAPHAMLPSPGGQLSTIDLFTRTFTLLTETEPWTKAAEAVAAHLRIPLKVPHTTNPPNPTWPDAYGVTPEGAVLVRPDGVVAWRARGTGDDPERELRVALTRILSR